MKKDTHCTLVFYPLTGQAIEKHDSFLDQTGEGMAITEFSGSAHTQGGVRRQFFSSGGRQPLKHVVTRFEMSPTPLKFWKTPME